jgi:hypothetical protein
MKFLLIPFLLLSLSAWSAVPPKAKNALRNSAILTDQGAIQGGLAGAGFSILEFKSQVAKSKKLERLTIAMGDSQFQPYQGAPGYYHIENAKNSNRVVMNFMQTINSKFDEKSLRSALKNSPFVKSSQITFDPQTQTLSLILELKKQAGLRVTSVNGNQRQTAHLKIDLFEQSLLNQNKKLR